LLSFVKGNKVEVIFVSCLSLFTVIICTIQFLGFERSLSLDLTNPKNISTRDDRVSNGKSVSSYQITSDGVKFKCEIIYSTFRWPYCELKFNLSSIINGTVEGRDLSGLDRIGLWIEHDHINQSGTRVELHNFNDAYSKESDVNSLKYNSIEFFENKVITPTWIKLHSFYVPIWWNERNDIANGGTDFTNIRTMSITSSGGDIIEGEYKLTVKRIEFRGKYIENDTLYFLLIIVWSSVAGFFVRQLSQSKNKVIYVNNQKIKWQEKASTDPLTGVNNRGSARDIFDELLMKSEVLSLLFIDIDFFKKINDNFGHNIGDDILVEFSQTILDTVDDTNILIRWGGEEFLLLCPQINLLQAKCIAEKIRIAIEKREWVTGIKLTASIGVAQKEHLSITDLISTADKALYQAKKNGRNQVVVSNTQVNTNREEDN
jgi:diguanylate cyclase (GGDEF)-like protein